MTDNPRLDGRFKIIEKNLWNAVYTTVADLQAVAYVTKEPMPFARRTEGKRLVCKSGTKWGELFDCAWFHFTGVVPKSAAAKPVTLLINIAGEGLIVDKRGNPLRGINAHDWTWNPTHGIGRWGKAEFPLLEKARGGEKIDVWVDGANNNLFGSVTHLGQFQFARVATLNKLYFDTFFDFNVLRHLFERTPDFHARKHQVRTALHDAADVLVEITEGSARKARAILAPELAKKNGDWSMTFSAVGHAHIDLMWLWPERETWRKGARTFSTALANMERYPDYVFGASQPQLYQWMKEKYPALYARVKQRVKQGRWEAQGCMWVEADTNVSGGEALVRQVLYGKRFFREEFGKEIDHLWLPDVFGYNAALPQILVKSGCPYFLTQKLSWSKVDVYPHHTFWWEGLDGSRVLTHFPPEDSYNSEAGPQGIEYGERNYKDKGVSDRGMTLFGCGDGGGGPGIEHLESLKRIRNLAGIAPVVQEPAAKFFPRLLKNAHRYATWAGELYLEMHQGTYTTQARNKRFNRKTEYALRECEFWLSAAATLTGSRVPKAELDRIWQRALLFQFHDILPGSSITRVYDETRADYARLLERISEMTVDASARLCRRANTAGMKAPVVVCNSLSWERTEWKKLGGGWMQVTVPSCGWTVVDTKAAPRPRFAVSAATGALENDLLKVRFGADGAVMSVFDKVERREAIARGSRANALKLYHDDGDAWDFAMDYANKPAGEFTLTASKAWTDGPTAVCEQRYTFGSSTLVQRISLTQGSRRLQFATEVDWRESNKMLRVDFPVAVLAREVTCDIQFGTIKRPTHRNTSWDMAKQEICAHKWVDLSEPAYGVALLNDCKYGHQVKDNVLNLNLLRSPGHPDPVADRAKHEFTYALLPHRGDHIAGGVMREGYELNVPTHATPVSAHRGDLPSRMSLVSVDKSNIIVEAVKPSEDDMGTVVRLYEASGSATKAALRVSTPARKAVLTDLLERPLAKLPMKRSTVPLSFGPFEILTVKLG
jgi:alpha-mannosidase